MSPDQSFFLRENFKLRLLNARPCLAEPPVRHRGRPTCATRRRRWRGISMRGPARSPAWPSCCARWRPGARRVCAAPRRHAGRAHRSGRRALRQAGADEARRLAGAAVRCRRRGGAHPGANDGLASFYWAGWRIDLSLNLFLLLLIAGCFALVTAIQAIESLTTLPRRARQWRLAQRERMAQSGSARGADRVFRRALQPRPESGATRTEHPRGRRRAQQDPAFESLAYLLAASSAHRLQDRRVRDEAWQRAFDQQQRPWRDR